MLVMANSSSAQSQRELGTIGSSELLLNELYVDLRKKVRAWSNVTRQTPQARMGYVGQHLTSVVTGFPGGRSGARGFDLVLPGDKHAEIKTCYRVDQLGSCVNCKASVSSIEFICPNCGGVRIARREDSKWLITIRNEQEMETLFDPVSYYLVLFDFSQPDALERVDADGDGDSEVITDRPLNINARIWVVNPQHPGFALCMVDYYANIKAKSASGAPFNLWPYSLKFQLMNPLLIYHAFIRSDDTIETMIFPGKRGIAIPYPIMSFLSMRGSYRNLTTLMLMHFASNNSITVEASPSRMQILESLEQARISKGWTDDWLSKQLAELMYRDKIRGNEQWLPMHLQKL